MKLILYYVMFFYVLVGSLLMFFPRYRRAFVESTSISGRQKIGNVKLYLYKMTCFVVSIAIWPIILFELIFIKKSIADDLNNNAFFQDQKELLKCMELLADEDCVEGQLVGSYGAFGHDVTNPVPTKTVLGSRRYLDRLRHLRLGDIRYERIGSFSSPVSLNPVDGYMIYDSSMNKLCVLYISSYSKINSDKAPDNFRLLK